MLVECSHCGAPLNVESRSSVVACAYCNRRHRVPRMRTLAPDTPTDWKPPEVWTPPPDARARSRPLRFHPVRVVAGVVLTAFRVALVGVGVLVAVAFSVFGTDLLAAVAGGTTGDATAKLERATGIDAKEQLARLERAVSEDGKLEALGDKLGSVLGGGFWNGEEPYTCGGNQRATVREVTATLTGRTAIRAEGNCELRVVACRIDAWEGIAIAGNAHVVVEQSQITTKGTGIAVSGNGELELVDSTVESEQTAIDARNNASLILATGRVEGKQAAVALTGNAHGEAREAEVVGKVRGRAGRLKGVQR